MVKIVSRLTAVVVSIVLVANITPASFRSLVSADPVLPADWLDTSANPILDAQWTVSADTYTENTKKPHEQCEQRTFITRPKRVGQSEQTKSACWYRTPMGWTSGQHAVANGESIAGLISGMSTNANFYPTTNSSVVYERKLNTSSNYHKFHLSPVLTKNTNSNGSVSYSFSAGDTLTLKYQSGSNLTATIYDLNYSSDGRYATVVSNGLMLRIDLTMKKIFRFGDPAPLGPGHNPFTKVSLSDDGSYAVATVTNANDGNRWMRVYDNSACLDTEYTYISTTSASCSYRDFKNFIGSSVPSFSYYTMGEFVTNDTIAFYHKSSGSPPLYTMYLMSIVELAGGKYISLGDSLSSGEGTFDYISPTDGQDESENMCHTSNVAFPALIHNALSLDQYNSFACSGAKSVNITGGSLGYSDAPENNPDADNQYHDDDLGPSDYWTPGLVKQIQRVEDEKPNIVTISVGINDAGFESKLRKCLSPGTCFGSYGERKAVAQDIASQFDRLSDAYRRVRDAAAPAAKIYVIGYPSIVDPEGASCAVNVKLDTAEKQFVEAATDWMNEVIEAAADRAGAYYVDVEDALYGHRMCEADVEDGVAANGLTAGHEQPAFTIFGWGINVIGNETYHPNKFGHRLLRDAIITETGAFTATAPAPDASVTSPVIDDSMPLLIDYADDFGLLRKPVLATTMSSDVMYKTDSTIEASVNGADFNTKSGTAYTAELHSTPVPLGTFTSDDNGNISVSATMPSGIDPGFHTLHVYGKDMDNNDVDIYKTVYIAEDENDWDGDEIENDVDACPVSENSGLDEDEDGVDDACDPVIGELPDEEPEELGRRMVGDLHIALPQRKYHNLNREKTS